MTAFRYPGTDMPETVKGIEELGGLPDGAGAAANLYRDRSLDVRGVAHKVQAMLDAFIEAQGIDPKVPPIEILDRTELCRPEATFPIRKGDMLAGRSAGDGPSKIVADCGAANAMRLAAGQDGNPGGE
ncbi:hypothetical protein [Paracoccus mutanolyticus]|nr:hypothetical protein [Paracoccus mutanolyticus]